MLLALAIGALCMASCQDDAEAMARQQLEMTRAARANQQTPANDTVKPAAEPSGKPSADTGGAAEEPAADEEPAEEEYTGPKVEVNILELKAPYPEFDGKGRYTLKVEVSSQELLKRGVWDILFLDAEGNEVARDRQDLKIPMGDHPMVLKFSSVFCLSKPESVELRQTDLTATAAAEDGGNAAGGSGDAVGGRRGVNTGGGSSSGGSNDDEDEFGLEG